MGICYSYMGPVLELLGLLPYLKDYNGMLHWRELEADKLPTFECRQDDVWVCSFPRSGTTITQQIVYLVLTENFEDSRRVSLDTRFPFLDMYQPVAGFKGFEYVRRMSTENPRMIKSHLHYALLPNQLKNGIGKIIYVARNPKSSVPSLFKLQKEYYKYPTMVKSLEEFLELFLADKTYCSPWGLHVSQYWEYAKTCDNILVLQFDDLVKNRKSVIRQIGTFLGKNLRDDVIDAIFTETSLASMKTNGGVNQNHMKIIMGKSESSFINDGLTDGWKATLSPDMINKMDDMIKRTVGNTDLKFD